MEQEQLETEYITPIRIKMANDQVEENKRKTRVKIRFTVADQMIFDIEACVLENQDSMLIIIENDFMAKERVEVDYEDGRVKIELSSLPMEHLIIEEPINNLIRKQLHLLLKFQRSKGTQEIPKVSSSILQRKGNIGIKLKICL